MGADKQTTNNAHTEGLDTIVSKLDIAARMLCGRCIAEPWSFHRIEAILNDKMLRDMGRYGSVISDCRKQYKESGSFTPGSLSLGKGDGIAKTYLELTTEDAGCDVDLAIDMFLEVYAQKVEYDIWLAFPGWLTVGKTAEEIRIESEKMRMESGAIVNKGGSDGKEDFETALTMALDGKVVDYPVKPCLSELRKKIRCYEAGDYVVVSALSGVGKSYYALDEIYYNATAGVPCTLINLENTPKNIQKRLWQKHAGEFFRPDLRGPEDLMRKRIQCWEQVKRLPVQTSNPGRSLPAVLSKIRQDWHEHGIQLAVVDYGQLIYIPGYKGNRNYELDSVSAHLRALALELGIVVIVLVQQKQEVSKSGDKRGGLYDVKDCAGFAHDAPIVYALYRPEYFDIKECDGFEYPEGYADVVILKGRESGIGIAKCQFDPVNGFHDVPQHPFPHQTAGTIPPPEQSVSQYRPNLNQDLPF